MSEPIEKTAVAVIETSDVAVIEASTVDVMEATAVDVIETSDVAVKKLGILNRTQTIVLCAMFTTLVYLFTMLNINPLGIPGGLVHLGNIPFFIAAILFGKKVGALSGGIGMALFDLLSGTYANWAPFTLVIGLAIGFVVALIAEGRKTFPFFIFAMVAAAAIKVVGYYIAEGILYGNWISPVASIPGNLMQVGVGAVIVLIIIEPLRIAAKKTILRSSY